MSKKNIFETQLLRDCNNTKVPPHSNNAELSVLGAMMLERSAILKAIELLQIESFYNQANRMIFEVMISMYNRGIEIDIVTLGDELQKKNYLETIGGTNYLLEINSKTPTAANVEHYAKIVSEKFAKRAIIEQSRINEDLAFDETNDSLEVLQNAVESISNLDRRIRVTNEITMSNLCQDFYNNFEEIKNNIQKITYSGISDLDRSLGGLFGGDLTIIAARPSIGKSAIMQSMAFSLIRKQIPVGFFSFEVGKIPVMVSMVSKATRINSINIRYAKVTEQEHSQIITALSELTELPFYLDNSKTRNIFDICLSAKRMKEKHDIQILFFDYLQLMKSPKKQVRENEISEISGELKYLAMELNIPIIVGSQLNRECEKRTDKKPLLADLRESGSIEQDADNVVLLHRPEFYGLDFFESEKNKKGEIEEVTNKMRVYIPKYRMGDISQTDLAFIKEFTLVTNLEKYRDLPFTHFQETEKAAF